jgi:hypothetical protein
MLLVPINFTLFPGCFSSLGLRLDMVIQSIASRIHLLFQRFDIRPRHVPDIIFLGIDLVFQVEECRGQCFRIFTDCTRDDTADMLKNNSLSARRLVKINSVQRGLDGCQLGILHWPLISLLFDRLPVAASEVPLIFRSQGRSTANFPSILSDPDFQRGLDFILISDGLSSLQTGY